jgi:outer membrane protein OmpA-like peptidoglycan-associated protein
MRASARAERPAGTDRGPVVQRKCTCGARSGGLAGTCDECRGKRLQTKVRIGPLGDRYEREADRIAERVMASGLPAARQPATALRGDGALAVPRLQMRATPLSRDEAEPAPPSVDAVLREPGHALDTPDRLFMEARFGHDFSAVRVHTGASATTSAQAIGAHAYTVGHHIAFDEGRYRAGAPEGRRLLAHELAHVLQQRGSERQLQRWATCTPARLSREDCPPRDPGEIQAARTNGMAFVPGLRDVLSGAQGAAIVGFDIGKATIKPNLHGQPLWKSFLEKLAKNKSRWKLLGFTDCHGDDGLNEKLRAERAKAVYDLLPKALQAQITSYEGAPAYDCITENGSAPDRTVNRSVALILDYAVADFKPQEVEGCIPPQQSSASGKKCKFYIYDSTESTGVGWLWEKAAFADAMLRPATYVIASGNSIEEMLYRILNTYAGKDCDCTDELQFWSHGSSGNGMWISQGKGEFTKSSFDIPGLAKYGDGPITMPGYREWHDALTTEQRRLVLLRRTICSPDSEIYYRSCQAFQGEKGQDFAKASATFWRSEVLGHTKLIGLSQPGKRSLKPCQEPYWSIAEGLDQEAKKPGKDPHTKPK